MRTISVLIVDANPAHLERIGAQLSEIGCRVIAVGTGVEALAALMNEEHFDVALSDLRLKRESGLELFLALRKAGFCVPVILFSDHAIAIRRDELTSLGITDLLQKPFYRDEVENCVARLVAKARREARGTLLQ